MATPFIPSRLPVEDIDWERLVGLIGAAHATIARYDAMLQGMPNADVLMAPLLTREAVLSSRIEGTNATVVEVFEFDVDPDKKTPRFPDIEEVVNYRTAMRLAEVELRERPMNLNLVKRMHGKLLDGVRGHDKGAGRFRKIQNWIGPAGCSIDAAIYVPPPPEHLGDLLDNWERYYHDDARDRLVQLAIVHAQFEMIHPFVDGNGRLGRIVLPLFLAERGILIRPTFYLSAYMERKRDLYMASLAGISRDGDWQAWIEFFLEAVINQGRRNTDQARSILDLYESMKEVIQTQVRTRFAIETIDALFASPLFSGPVFAARSAIPSASAHRILKDLVDAGVLTVLRAGKGRRPALYSFDRLVAITDNVD